RREAEDDAGLGLGLDRVGVDRLAAIDGGDDAVNLQFAGRADGNFGNLRDDRLEGFLDGDAASMTCGQRRSPARLPRRKLQRRKMARAVLQQRAAELERVLARFMRKLVDEALGEESVLRM